MEVIFPTINLSIFCVKPLINVDPVIFRENIRYFFKDFLLKASTGFQDPLNHKIRDSKNFCSITLATSAQTPNPLIAIIMATIPDNTEAERMIKLSDLKSNAFTSNARWIDDIANNKIINEIKRGGWFGNTFWCVVNNALNCVKCGNYNTSNCINTV